MVCTPCAFICVCVMTLTDCGVSRGDSASPVVVRIDEAVNESVWFIRLMPVTTTVPSCTTGADGSAVVSSAAMAGSAAASGRQASQRASGRRRIHVVSGLSAWAFAAGICTALHRVALVSMGSPISSWCETK